jgi:hypothetical protein
MSCIGDEITLPSHGSARWLQRPSGHPPRSGRGSQCGRNSCQPDPESERILISFERLQIDRGDDDLVRGVDRLRVRKPRAIRLKLGEYRTIVVERRLTDCEQRWLDPGVAVGETPFVDQVDLPRVERFGVLVDLLVDREPGESELADVILGLPFDRFDNPISAARDRDPREQANHDSGEQRIHSSQLQSDLSKIHRSPIGVSRYPTPRTVSIGSVRPGRSSLRRKFAMCTSTTFESPS